MTTPKKAPWLERLGGWVDQEYCVSTQGLALYRLAFAAHLLTLTLAEYVRVASWLGEQPQALFYPPLGPMVLAPGLPSTPVLWAMVAALTASALALLVGYRTRLASVCVSVCMISLDMSVYSLGKIDHGRVLLVLVPLILSASAWGDAWSVDARRAPRIDADEAPSAAREASGWPMSLLALTVGFGMMSAGLPKLLGGWLDWSTQASYAKTYSNALQLGRDHLLASFAVSHPHRIIWELFDWMTVLFELGFLAAVSRRRAFGAFLIAAIGFHWGVLLTMNIPFPDQMIVYAAFLPHGALARRPRVAAAAGWLTARPWRVVSLTAASFVAVQLGAQLMIAGFSAVTWCIYLTAAVTAAYVCAGQLKAWRR